MAYYVSIASIDGERNAHTRGWHVSDEIAAHLALILGPPHAECIFDGDTVNAVAAQAAAGVTINHD